MLPLRGSQGQLSNVHSAASYWRNTSQRVSWWAAAITAANSATRTAALIPLLWGLLAEVVAWQLWFLSSARL
jgi:hypothetical protein